ncbi:protein sneaky [Malaya genurostris]|uniref:protein sneaky n=1 Tax=Malaya genurostris TaxID=325434 RepID=UPI0026F3C3BD|nr:protein sneaky [Malaya genurostris]
MRCFSSLCLVGFLGRAGRSMMKAIVLGYILTGPINNLGLNAREVVRVFTCSTVLTYNLTKVRFDLMTKPFQNALVGSKEQLEQIKHEFRAIVDIVEPIRSEVEDSEEFNTTLKPKRQMTERIPEQYHQMYSQKLVKRCKSQLENGVKRCKHEFQKVYDQCNLKLPIVIRTLMCWPLKIDFVCSSSEMFGDEDEICSPDEVINEEFGQDYGKLMNAEEELIGGLDGVQIAYEFVDIEQHSGYLYRISFCLDRSTYVLLYITELLRKLVKKSYDSLKRRKNRLIW